MMRNLLGLGSRDFLSQGPITVGWVPGRKELILQQHKKLFRQIYIMYFKQIPNPSPFHTQTKCFEFQHVGVGYKYLKKTHILKIMHHLVMLITVKLRTLIINK